MVLDSVALDGSSFCDAASFLPSIYLPCRRCVFFDDDAIF